MTNSKISNSFVAKILGKITIFISFLVKSHNPVISQVEAGQAGSRVEGVPVHAGQRVGAQTEDGQAGAAGQAAGGQLADFVIGEVKLC